MRRAIIMAAAVWACGCGVASAAALEAYGKLPTMDMVTISPDGAKVAFVQPTKNGQAVVIDQIDPAAYVTALSPTEQKVRALIWADPDHLLVVKSQTGFAVDVESARSEWFMVQSLDLAKRKSTPLLSRSSDRGADSFFHGTPTMNVIDGLPEVRTVKGRTTVFARGVVFIDSRGADGLISVDIANGSERVVENALSGKQSRAWIVGEDGGLLAQTTYDEQTQIWTLRLRRGDGWFDAYSTRAPNDPPSVLGLSPDGGSLVLDLKQGDSDTEDREISLADGKLSDPIDRYDGLSSLIEDPATHRIIGGVKMGMEPSYVFFDPKDQAAWNAVVKTFPDEDVEPVSWSDDRKRVAVRVTGFVHGVAYAVVDLDQHKAWEIGGAYDGITPNDLAEVRIATYPAKDGTPIHAFLTLPNGRAPKNLPLIVLPHGGPAARDEAGFDWWAQALASRGYAVLQPQFRGSTGFGWTLESAGFSEFGRKMQSDLSDGVRALASAGYIDPKRVCIVGGSYGGYAALAGVTLEHGVYRCAVAVAGISDMRKFIGGRSADAKHDIGVRFWDRFVGATDPSDPVFDQISPLRHAADASAPILLIHGRDDTVVPIEQSQQMQSALKEANKPVEMVTLPSEDHWLSREETRVQMLQATVAFLEKNNPPR